MTNRDIYMRICLGLVLVFFVCSIILLSAQEAISGNIYEVTSENQADVKVLFVNSESQADLLVYVTKSETEAKGKDAIWHYVTQRSIASATVYFVRSRSQADLKVYIVKSRSQAGWRTSNKFRGRLR
jgi:hypothetical protein